MANLKLRERHLWEKFLHTRSQDSDKTYSAWADTVMRMGRLQEKIERG